MELHLQGTLDTITANGNLRLLILTVLANGIVRFLKNILDKHTSEENTRNTPEGVLGWSLQMRNLAVNFSLYPVRTPSENMNHLHCES